MKRTGSLVVTTPSDRTVALTRVFDAPKRLVWAAYTKPELMKRWGGGPPGHKLLVCEIDVRVGGRWRWVVEAPDGSRMGLGGRYLEIVPEERLVSTDEFDQPWYEGDATASLSFAEEAGKTTLTLSVEYRGRLGRAHAVDREERASARAGSLGVLRAGSGVGRSSGQVVH